MKRCTRCLYPDTKPDLHFDEEGVCSACRSFEKRPSIDWDERKEELLCLLDRHGGKCIVPSSGGKDSAYQVIKLLELGADVTVVTATTCHLTEIGRKNIDNLSRYVTTIEVSPNKNVRAKLNRIGLEMVGDISWPEHCAIFTTPFRMASKLNIPLIFYGECPQSEYGGPQGSDEAKQMTLRWISEFGGFLGLRPQDLVDVEGITAKDMRDYMLPNAVDGLEAHFLGAYSPWDSHENARIAKDHGMIQHHPSAASWWGHENLDNAQTGIHDHMMYLKYGFGRACSQLSVDIRNKRITRDAALHVLGEIDGIFPESYGDVDFDQMIGRIGLTREGYLKIQDQFTNWDLFTKIDGQTVLKDAGN